MIIYIKVVFITTFLLFQRYVNAELFLTAAVLGIRRET